MKIKKNITLLFVLASTICTSFNISHAASLRDSDYITIEGGAFKFGDEVVDDIFGTYAGLFGEVNKIIDNHFSVLGTLGGIYGEGSSEGIDLTHTGLKAGLGLVFMVAPENSTANPYLLAGGLYEYNEIEGEASGTTQSEDDSDYGYEVGGGIEIEMGSKALIDLGLAYQSIGDFDSLTTKARLGYEIGANTLGLLTFGYALDEEDIRLLLGVGVKY